MAFEQINSTEIEAGKPTKQELFSKTKNSFDDHETRMLALEASLLVKPPLFWNLQGMWSSVPATIEGVAKVRLFSNITLTSGRVFVVDAGSSGTVEVDIQYKRGGAAFASVFSTRPSVAFGAGDNALSSNAVVSVTSLLAGDILRLDVLSGQVGCEEFHVYLTYEDT